MVETLLWLICMACAVVLGMSVQQYIESKRWWAEKRGELGILDDEDYGDAFRFVD